MATVRATSPELYVGLAGDTKPTTGVPAGSVFIESDTGEKHIFDGQSTWVKRIYPTTDF